MAATGIAVTVLTPNGRRQTVKVSPNTPLLQVTCFKERVVFSDMDGLLNVVSLLQNQSKLFFSELACLANSS